MKTRLFIYPLFLLFGYYTSYSQTTLGLLKHTSLVEDGYILMYPRGEKQTYLINNCGELVHEWLTLNTNGVSYILEDGSLLKSGQTKLEKFSWDNQLLWSADLQTFGIDQHHDIFPLTNGNILLLTTNTHTTMDALAKGRKPSLAGTKIESEGVIEIKPIGTDTLEIVWEWSFWNHLIQDYDDTKENYNTISEHPEWLDINIETRNNIDWIHANSVGYNEELDQLIISSRNLNELFVIDHSTTTEEAKGSIGGKSGKGGDLLFRWGNPQNYDQGNSDDQRLFGPHTARWVPESHENGGMISILNNGFERTPSYSGVRLINATTDQNGNYSNLDQEPYFSWSSLEHSHPIYTATTGGLQFLPNGNFLMCESEKGTLYEFDRDGELHWSYKIPISKIEYTQGEEIPEKRNQLFRANKYPLTYPAFEGKDLAPIGIIENENELSEQCAIVTSISKENYKESIFNKIEEGTEIIVYDLQGRQRNIDHVIQFTTLKKGLYLVKFINNDGQPQILKTVLGGF